MLSEIKLDLSFPHAQFSIEGYSKPYRLASDRNGGGLILFNRKGLPTKLSISKFNSGNKAKSSQHFLQYKNLHP